MYHIIQPEDRWLREFEVIQWAVQFLEKENCGPLSFEVTIDKAISILQERGVVFGK